MNDTGNPDMIWRHILLALPEVESVPSYVLDRVGRIARGLGAELELFNCIYDPDLVRASPTEEALRERIRARVDAKRMRLERVADTLRDQSLEVRSIVRWDYPIFEAIIRQVLRSGPSLLIVPAGHLGHAGPVALTYTDARLIEACPCPLLLLKTEQVYREGPVVAAVDPGHIHEKPAELDDVIVSAAKTFADALAEAPVHVYHAVAPLEQPAASADDGRIESAPIPQDQRQLHWTEREHEARQIAHRHDLSDRLVYVEVGAVEATLPAYAREAHANAVVMGAVSRAYPDRVVFGYTAEKVLNALDCDVLIVKPPGFRTPVPRHPPAAGKRQARRARTRTHTPTKTPIQTPIQTP